MNDEWFLIVALGCATVLLPYAIYNTVLLVLELRDKRRRSGGGAA